MNGTLISRESRAIAKCWYWEEEPAWLTDAPRCAIDAVSL